MSAPVSPHTTKQRLAQSLCQLERFLALRDLPQLSPTALEQTYGYPQADVLVLFGGSTLEGADVFAKAIQQKLAKTSVIVGGYGHTSKRLLTQIENEVPDLYERLQQMERPVCEAAALQIYLMLKHGIQADLLEMESTNCGNNITLLLELLDTNQIEWNSMISIQDSSMQKRMAAGFQKYVPQKQIINYAAWQAMPVVLEDALVYSHSSHGMWSLSDYAALLVSEIPRLHDTQDGYGPAGKGFIAHVDVEEEILEACCFVVEHMNADVRPSQPTRQERKEP